MGGFAWVTLATNDSYSLGALVLAHSLKRVGTKHDLAVLVTPGVTGSMREKLSAVFNLVQEVNVLDSRDEANLALLARPELGITFTKLHCWRLTQYERCVFVDADTLVVRNCDELFEREELSAAPDVGWPDCFNSGVFVFTPSQQTFASLTAFAASKGSFDGGDQGLLNSYFSDWAHKDISKHLPFIYNMCSTASYSYLPAYKQFGDDVRIIHFIGSTKPWLQCFDSLTGQVQPTPGTHHLQPLLQLWWNIFCESVHGQLSPVMASTTLAQWHDILLPMSPIPINTRHHVFHDATDRTTDEIDEVEPDFSQFRDPWDDYTRDKELNQPGYHYEGHKDQFPTHHHTSVPSESDQSHYQGHSLVENTQGHQDESPVHLGVIGDHLGADTRSPSHEFSHHHPQMQTHHHIHEEQNTHRHHENLQCKQESNNSHSQPHQDSSPPNFQSIEYRSPDCSHEDNRENQCHEDPLNRLTDFPEHRENNDFCRNDSSHHTPDRLKGQSDDSRVLSIDDSTFHFQYQSSLISTSTTTHTEIHSGDVDTLDTGIAGALAQLTLGESRSPEQIALEEHMRKYSWEQGQIDYMGRDSFDNIWKKICTTIDTAPTKEKTPPKEVTPPVDDEKAPELPTTATTVPLAKKAALAEETAPEEPKKLPQETTSISLDPQQTTPTEQLKPTEKQEEPTKFPAGDSTGSSTPTTEQAPIPDILRISAGPPLLPLTASPPILSLTSSPPILSIKEAGEKAQALTAPPPPKPKSENEEQLKKEDIRETVIPLGYTSPTTFETTTSLNLSESEKTQDVPESPVPIQVAESVLEADIKESVSEHIKPVTEEAISSISAPVQESVSAVVETLEPAVPVQAPPSLEAVPTQPNGTGGFDSDVKSDEDAPGIAIVPVVEAAPAPEPPSCPLQPGEALEITSVEESKVSESALVAEEALETLPEPQATIPKSLTQELLPEVPPLSSEPLQDSSPPRDSPEKSPEPVSETSEALDSSQKSGTPEKLPTPATPTVIEATPPTSPQLELSQDQSEEAKASKKPVKKLVKKTSSEEKTESSEADDVKKPAKKVVKKVVKKPREGEEGGEGTSEKPKKAVRVVKKGSKAGETLQAESSVPETPPPPGDTPVPPKRKAKPGTTKPVKKPETEQ